METYYRLSVATYFNVYSNAVFNAPNPTLISLAQKRKKF